MSLLELKCAFFAFFSNDKMDLGQIFFQEFGENTCPYNLL